MIAAGEKVETKREAVLDTVSKFFCPTKNEEKCRGFLEGQLTTLTSDMAPEGADVFAAEELFPAAKDVYNGCVERHLPNFKKKADPALRNRARECFHSSIQNEPEAITILTGNFTDLPFVDYLKYRRNNPLLTRVGGAYDRLKSVTAALEMTVPDEMKAYLTELKETVKLPKLAYPVEGLFREAMARAPNADPKAVAESVMKWVKPRVDAYTARPEGEKADARKSLEDEIGSAMIVSVDPASGKVGFDQIPEKLWKSGDNENNAIAKKAFARALTVYMVKPNAEKFFAENREAAKDAIADALIKAAKDKKLADVEITDVKVDENGKPTEIVTAEAAKAEDVKKVQAPKELIAGLGFDGDEYAKAAVDSLWAQVEAKEPKAKTDENVREQLISNLRRKLGGKSAFQIALMRVEKVEHGVVKIDDAPVELLGGVEETTLRKMEVIQALATLEKMRGLYQAAMETDKGKELGREKVAKTISDQVGAMIEKKFETSGAVDASKDLLILKFKEFDENGVAVLKPEDESDKPPGLHGHIKAGGATNFDKSSGLLEGDIGYKWKFGKNDALYVDFTTGLVIGAEADPFGYGLNPANSDALLLRKSVDNKKRALLMKALLAVGREEEGKVNYSVEAGIDRDDDWLEANKGMVRGNVEVPLGKDGKAKLTANFGGGWLFKAFNLDPEDENQYEVGGGFIEGGLGVSSPLWSEDAKLKLSGSYTYAFDDSVFNVFCAVAKFKQTLAKVWDLKLTGIYAGLHGNKDMDNIHIGIVKPQIAWYALDVSDKLYLSPEVTGQFVGVSNGGDKFTADLMLYIRTRKDEEPGSFAVGVGAGHAWRTAENDIPIDAGNGFDTGAAGDVPSAITPDPGVSGWYGMLVGAWYF